MAQQLNETRISIRGESIQLRTDLGGDKLKGLAMYVNNMMDRLDPKETLPANKLSILTSLSLAEEIHEVREESREFNERMTERVSRMNAMLDEALNSR